MYGRGLEVSFGVFLRGVHVAFGVDAVVVLPVGDGGNGYAGAVGLAVCHGHEGFVASVAPPPDADSLGIDVGQGCHVACCGDLVLCFVFAEVEVDAGFECGASSACSASVYAGYDESLCG